MGDVEQIVFSILSVIGILFTVRIFFRVRGQLKELFDDPNKITPPGKLVYRDLKKGNYYIFVLSTYAIKRLFRKIMPNLNLIEGAEFRVRNLTDDREIELEDITRRYCKRFGNRFSTVGMYSVRKFRLDCGGDVELEVSGGRFEGDGNRVFISGSIAPGAGLVFGIIGRMLLLILALGVLHIVIMNILERLGVVY